jgi:GNAT superfamily N-acetyltransferase
MNQDTRLITSTGATPALTNELGGWFEAEFGPRADRWRSADYYVLLYIDGKVVGRLGMLNTKVSVGNQIIRVGGIGGVATKPEFRHRGVASAMLSRAAEFMKSDLGVEFGFLLCRHEVSPVYAKLGWITVAGPTKFTRAGVTAIYPNDTMILPLVRNDWPPGPIDMLGLPW